MLSPSQIAQSLNIPSSTLRRWSVRFEKFLSRRHSPGEKRRYALEDLNTLKRIRDYSQDGVPLDRIEELLMVELPGEQNQTKALIQLSDIAEAISTARATIASMSAQLDHQAERIRRLEEWLALPWYRRLNKRPPL